MAPRPVRPRSSSAGARSISAMTPARDRAPATGWASRSFPQFSDTGLVVRGGSRIFGSQSGCTRVAVSRAIRAWIPFVVAALLIVGVPGALVGGVLWYQRSGVIETALQPQVV